MKRVLVIGASGFIGRATVEKLSAVYEGELHAVYHNQRPEFSNQVILHKVDLFNSIEIEDLFSNFTPTHLVQLAWCADHGTYWKDPANLEWVSINFAIARNFVKNGGKRAVFTGTSAEYDWSGGQPLNEFTTPLIPRMLYGGTKLGLYWSLERFFEQEGISMVWGRLFNPFGPYEDPRRLIPKTCLRLLKGEKIQFDDGLSRRDFLHVDDVGIAIAALLSGTTDGPVNIASGNAVSIREVVTQIAANYNCPGKISFGSTVHQNDLPDTIVADINRLKNEFKFQPEKNFITRLQETCQWWADNIK